MPISSFERDAIAGCREIRFIDRQESNYPTLMRLCMDFDLCVLQLVLTEALETAEASASDAAHAEFILANRDYASVGISPRSPACASLNTLEQYVHQHQIDILHDYLFGEMPEQLALG